MEFRYCTGNGLAVFDGASWTCETTRLVVSQVLHFLA